VRLEVLCIYRGVVRKCGLDVLILLASVDMPVLETKGQDTEQDQVKRVYLDEWVSVVATTDGLGVGGGDGGGGDLG
jgi:type III restriction enzyme